MSRKSDSILDKDLYELFGVLQNASVKDIKTAYRKKALEYHPDKNPDNPKANELFHELSRALAVLIDENARSSYDKILNAKLAAKKRTQILDSKRKKFKEDLEEKERRYQENIGLDLKTEQEKFEKEFERLRKLSSKQVEEEIEYMRQLIKEKRNNTTFKIPPQCKIKLKWSAKNSDTNGGYNEEILTQIFSKYGSVSAIVISQKKKGCAMVEFANESAARNALALEKGLVNNPLTLTLVEVEITNNPDLKSSDFDSFTVNESFRDTLKPSEAVDENMDDFEAKVLQKLRDIEKKKNEVL